MKKLLERWSKLEPHLIRQDWIGDYHIELGDETYIIIDLNKELGNIKLSGIQWAVQQAIIEKGWYFQIRYNNGLCIIEMGPVIPSPRYTKDDANLVEVLLATYLTELETHVNP